MAVHGVEALGFFQGRLVNVGVLLNALKGERDLWVGFRQRDLELPVSSREGEAVGLSLIDHGMEHQSIDLRIVASLHPSWLS